MTKHPDNIARIQITPSELVAKLFTTEYAQNGDGYVSACALGQIWSDLNLLAEASQQSSSIRHQTKFSAIHAQQAALSIACGHKITAETTCSQQISLVLQGQFSPWMDLLTRILALPLPECYGYDLGDTEVCVDDAIRFAHQFASGRPIVVVGLRSGGSFLTPRWVAGLTQINGVSPEWLTLRPLRNINAYCQYHHSELDSLFRLLDTQSERPDVVIVDDQPDTGSTVKILAQSLAFKAENIWFASIGHVRKITKSASWSTVFSRSPLMVREQRPLWQLLLKNDHCHFLSTLASTIPPSDLLNPAVINDTDTQIFIHCPTMEKRYGLGEAWLPWNSSAMEKYARRLINPKKTPLLVTDRHEKPLLHLRFIGESIYGLTEFNRIKQANTAHPKAWFFDGYHISQHLPGLRPLRDLIAETSHENQQVWFTQCNTVIQSTSQSPLMVISGQLPQIPIGAAIRHAWERLQHKIGEYKLPDLPIWLNSLNIPLFAGSTRPRRSSLSHAFGDWHWQIDNDGHLYRFQQEANWGGISWPELEMAVFLLVYQLPPTTLQLLYSDNKAENDNSPVIYTSLPVALLLLLDGFRRDVRQFSPIGKIRLCEDITLLFQTLTQYHDLIIESMQPTEILRSAYE
ncbi:Neamine phosphoribosyltransferase [Xenorhabdus beddingii]|uniref:Neamine phosphoribosyltransferase n=1 Tax=Xenorhabdus beddingii TaxID=40578 RepID=A0A1Y2SS38_9GAMM|nr:hypothetical protein [Xenorhabdus beddingii]OTA21865.1 Neamine phosphoribosyltransferase [Xenorhabdus beddingii]